MDGIQVIIKGTTSMQLIEMNDPQFIIYDLRVETIEGDRPFVCSHQVGSAFEVRGENLHFEADKPLATDHVIACPDPHCGGRFRISRIGKRVIRRADATVEPLPESNPWTE